MTPPTHKILQRPNGPLVSTGDAAEQLGVTPQTVRNWLQDSELRGHRDGRGRWQIETASVEEYLAQHGRGNNGRSVADLQREIERLTVIVGELRASETTSAQLIEPLERERDRYRADASAARAAALSLITAAREIDGVVRQTLRVLELQADALVQLLAPGSPADLTP